MGVIMVKILTPGSKGVERGGNVISISVAFGNATALPIMLIGTIDHLFAQEDRLFLTLCVMVYGTINRALMYTAGSAICCGQMKPSVLLNEVNIACVLGLVVCFFEELTGLNLMSYMHHKGNWLDFVGTG